VTVIHISGRTVLFTVDSRADHHVSKETVCVKAKGLNTTSVGLPNNGLVSATVGKTFSLADRDTKRANGTSQRHRVKYAITCK